VLAGSYARAGETLEVSVRLTEAATDEVIHAGREAGAVSGLFALQDAVAAQMRELEPGSQFGPYFAGCTLIVVRCLDEAIAMLQRAIELESTFGMSWLALGWAHLEAGHPAEAARCFEQARVHEVHPVRTGPTTGAAAYLGEARRREGDLALARALAMEGLEIIERTDRMYRDTFRALALATLGRTALDQGDAGGARAAFTQLLAHLEGRDRTLGGGHHAVQALAGLTCAERDESRMDRALALFGQRDSFDWSWAWGSCDVDSLAMLARAARTVERGDQAAGLERLLAASRAPAPSV
jgi:tetratricopeptide (TPR) repeat protein